MGHNRKQLFPRSGDYFKEGLRLLILNSFIFLIVGGGSYILFKGSIKARQMGFPLPLPLWLVLLGAGIPCFIFWFRYGKTFGSFLNNRRFTRGLALGVLGDIPGFIILYLVVNRVFEPTNPEIFNIMMRMLFLALFMTPILVALGALDQKN